METNLTYLHGRLDMEVLIEQGVSQGLSEAKLRACTAGLKSIFDSLSFGEQPIYERIDRDLLRQLEPETDFVVRSMSRSTAADVRTAGFHIMGVLDLKSFIPDLLAAIESKEEWERIEAVRALGRMSHPEVCTILQATTTHGDLHTRRAAVEALEHFRGSRE